MLPLNGESSDSFIGPDPAGHRWRDGRGIRFQPPALIDPRRRRAHAQGRTQGPFLYLGTTKLLGRDEVARLTAIGVNRYLRDTIGWLELTAAALLLIRGSGYLLHSLVAGVALIEVALLHRAPLAAAACVVAHGLSTWARSVHDRNRAANPPHPARRASPSLMGDP